MTDRATARVVGVLFLVGTAAGLVGLPLQESVVGNDDYLGEVSAHPDRLATGVLLQLVIGVALVALAVVIHPVLRRRTERLATGYVVARSLEAVVYLVTGAGLMALVSVSEDHGTADDPLWGLVGAAAYLTAGLLVLYGLEPLSTPQVALEAPLGLQEIALALWLVVKGFSVRAATPPRHGTNTAALRTTTARGPT